MEFKVIAFRDKKENVMSLSTLKMYHYSMHLVQLNTNAKLRFIFQ